MMEFAEARRENMWLRKMLMGPSGAGKTLGALSVATRLFDGELDVVGVDTEHGRMKLYADRFKFKHAELAPDHSPESWRAAIDAAYRVAPGGVLILDSFSHEWMGRNGVLQQADKFGDWKTIRPKHADLIEDLMALPMHVIVCVRAKMKYEVSEETVPGRDKPRQVIRKLGVGPIQDDAIIYEFDVVGMVDVETHETMFSNRCEPLVDTVRSLVPGDEVAAILTTWLSEGEAPAPIEAADDDVVAELIGSLTEEGVKLSVIEEKFAVARRENRGRLHPDYVERNLRESQERLAKKRLAKENREEAERVAAEEKSAAANAEGAAA